MKPMKQIILVAVALGVSGCATTSSSPAQSAGTPPAATSAAAQPSKSAAVTGKWSFSVETPMGTQSVPMQLTQTGSAVSGTTTDPFGNEVPVSGAVEGNALTLAVKVQTPGGEIQIDYKGVLTGNAVAGTATFGSFGEGKFTGAKE